VRFLLALTFLLSAQLPPQAARVQEYLDQHRSAWQKQWQALDVSPRMAEAIVYPEVLRYTVIRDIIEHTLNYGAYVSLGTKAVDFSVGRFQIKPSFAEKLEKAWMESGLYKQYDLRFDTGDDRRARKARILRLQKEKWQVRYVGIFLRLLYWSYGSKDAQGRWVQSGLETLPIEEQLRLAATAYNCGCAWPMAGHGDLDALRKHVKDKTFHFELGSGKYKLGSNEPAPHYCYADLAWEWYRQIVKQK